MANLVKRLNKENQNSRTVFIANIDDIVETRNAGHSVRAIWKALNDDGTFSWTYPLFRRLYKELVDGEKQPASTSKKVVSTPAQKSTHQTASSNDESNSESADKEPYMGTSNTAKSFDFDPKAKKKTDLI